MLKWLKNTVLRGILVERMCTNGKFMLQNQ